MALKHCDKVPSGAKSDRLQLTALLEYAREGDTLTVTKLCRLARNTKHLLEIIDLLDNNGVSLVVLNLGIATGRLMVTMIGAISTFERQLLLECQAEGIVLAKQKGEYKGNQPTARAEH